MCAINELQQTLDKMVQEHGFEQVVCFLAEEAERTAQSNRKSGNPITAEAYRAMSVDLYLTAAKGMA